MWLRDGGGGVGLRATVGGVVGRVGKLVFVKPLRARYRAEVGDVVVGRVAEVRDKRWKVELRARQEGVLMLSAVSLPGDVQRRRTQEDELSMRSVFREGDVVCAEVQQLYQDGAVVLHTRSAKYGKLEAGRLVQVDPVLIRRLKQHFVALPELGLFLVLGCNGYVWVGKAAVPEGGGAGEGAGGAAERAPVLGRDAGALSGDDFRRIYRAAGIVEALGLVFLPVHPAAVASGFRLSEELEVATADLSAPKFLEALAERLAPESAARPPGPPQ